MKKSIILIVLIVLLGGSFIGYKMYNKEHRNVAETEASESLSAAALFEVFDTDESAAMQKYSDQVVETWGLIYSVDLSNDLEPQVVLEANGDNGYIRCGFKTVELAKVKALKEGSELRLKGECKGINSAEGLDLLADVDVVLSNCIIIE